MGGLMFAQGVEGLSKMMESLYSGAGMQIPEISTDSEAVVLASHGLNSEDVSGSLPEMHVPVLLLLGTNDEFGFYSEMEAAARRLPNATMVTMPGMDHGQTWMLITRALPQITGFLAKANAEAK
jgi:pimeloyl-ACP methyl ester carboxylesterase